MAAVNELLILETVIISDRANGTSFDEILETVAVTDTLTELLVGTSIRESVTVNDFLGPADGDNIDSIVERVTVTETLRDLAPDKISESVTVLDTVTEDSAQRIFESVTVVDTVADARVAHDAVAESVTVLDFAGSAFQEDLILDPVVISDIVKDKLIFANVVEESVRVSTYISDAVYDPSIGSGATDNILESVTIADSVSGTLGAQSDSIFESVTVRDWIYTRDHGNLAWVMNIETGAPSIYDNFEFNSMVEHRGVLIGMARDGLYIVQRHQADDDEGRKVASKLITGFIDWDTDQRKRLRDVYIGYTGGQLELTVETYNQPYERYSYELIEREATAPRNNRVRVGRGLNSRFWRFTVENTAGKWHQIYDSSANVDVSNRRL